MPIVGSALKKRGIGRVERISDLQLIHAMPFGRFKSTPAQRTELTSRSWTWNDIATYLTII